MSLDGCVLKAFTRNFAQRSDGFGDELASLFTTILNEKVDFLFVFSGEGSDDGGPEGAGSLSLVTGEPVESKVLGAMVKERITEDSEEGAFIEASEAMDDS